jgi:hypothetical protein
MRVLGAVAGRARGRPGDGAMLYTEDSIVSGTGFVQPSDRVRIEFEARGANDFVELHE